MSIFSKKKILNPEVEQISDEKKMEKTSSLTVVSSVQNTSSDPFENFDLKSEYHEKNIRLKNPDLSNGQDETTTVKVYRQDRIDTVSPNELASIIKNNTDIQQVVVEKVSIREATRVSLLFEPKWSQKLLDQSVSLSEQDFLPAPRKEAKKLIKLEAIINKDFLAPDKSEHVFVKNIRPESLKFNFGENDNVEIPKAKPEALNTENEKEKTKTSFKLSLKSKSESSESKEVLNLDDQEKNVNYSRHTFIRKRSKVHNGYYYRAKDHMELFKVGSSYMKDFKSGLKNFSFSSYGLREEREKTVFGVCSYFNYHEDIDILIITSDFFNSFFHHYVGHYEENYRSFCNEEFQLLFRLGKGFDIVDFENLKKAEKDIRHVDFESYLDELLSSYDLVLWDLPEISILDSTKEVYFPIVRNLDNVSLIVGANVTKSIEIHNLLEYFKKYQVNIKGLLFSRFASKKGGRK